MAQKRMFSKEVVGSDAFLDMPTSSQLLYFHLGMEADDDGFIGNPKKVSRFIGASDDDLKILISKKFILLFESGVVVVKHHRMNNNWDKYNCKRTVYLEEFSQLNIKENKAYTLDNSQGESLQSADSLKTVFRIDKNRIEENRIDKTITEQSSEVDVNDIIDSFKDVNISYKKLFGNKSQRSAVTRLLKSQKKEMILQVMKMLPKTNKMAYFPSVTTPIQLEDKWSALESAFSRKKGELLEKGNKNKIYGL